MSAISICGISQEKFTEQTRAGLDAVNGSPVKKKQFDAFIKTQLGLKNSHFLHTCFSTRAPSDDSKTHFSLDKARMLISCIDGDSLDHELEITLLREALIAALTRMNESEVKSVLLSSIDPSDEDNEPYFSEGDATERFIKTLSATGEDDSEENDSYSDFIKMLSGTSEETCKRCSGDLKGGFCEDETCPYSDYMQSVEEDAFYEGRVPDAQRRHEITLSVTSDDGELSEEGDAALYFYTCLSDGTLPDVLTQLEGEGLSCDAGVDSIFEWMTGENAAFDAVLNYCIAGKAAGKENSGYQATLDEDELCNWLKAHAPAMLTRFPELFS